MEASALKSTKEEKFVAEVVLQAAYQPLKMSKEQKEMLCLRNCVVFKREKQLQKFEKYTEVENCTANLHVSVFSFYLPPTQNYFKANLGLISRNLMILKMKVCLFCFKKKSAVMKKIRLAIVVPAAQSFFKTGGSVEFRISRPT